MFKEGCGMTSTTEQVCIRRNRDIQEKRLASLNGDQVWHGSWRGEAHVHSSRGIDGLELCFLMPNAIQLVLILRLHKNAGKDQSQSQSQKALVSVMRGGVSCLLTRNGTES